MGVSTRLDLTKFSAFVDKARLFELRVNRIDDGLQVQSLYDKYYLF